jgi:hypothetical protein
LADTQESIFPPFHAACWSDQAWLRSPLHCDSSSAVAPEAGWVASNAHGYWRPLPLGWLKTLLPPDSRIVAWSPKPRTPFSVP